MAERLSMREEVLKREVARLRTQVESLRSRDCRTCDGRGSIDGFLLGTTKKCPACDGRGVRGY